MRPYAHRDRVDLLLAQTGIARLLAVTDDNTTVATMTLHDLVAGSRLAGGDSLRWRRRAVVILALVAGAGTGVGLDQLTHFGGLAFTCVTVAATVLTIRFNERSRSPTAHEYEGQAA